MPVQINEIIVRVTVDEQAAPAAQVTDALASSDDATSEALLEAVLEIIREKAER